MALIHQSTNPPISTIPPDKCVDLFGGSYGNAGLVDWWISRGNARVRGTLDCAVLRGVDGLQRPQLARVAMGPGERQHAAQRGRIGRPRGAHGGRVGRKIETGCAGPLGARTHQIVKLEVALNVVGRGDRHPSLSKPPSATPPPTGQAT